MFLWLVAVTSVRVLETYAGRIRVVDQAVSESYTKMTWTDSGSNQYWGGGAVHIERPKPRPDTVVIELCHFLHVVIGVPSDLSNKDQLQGGGAIFFEHVDLDCRECKFVGCEAQSGYGGGILCRSQSAANISGSSFDGCVCQSGHEKFSGHGGGAVAVREKSLTLTGCDFTGCQCPKAGGGAVCVAYSAYRTPEMTVIGCSFDGCTAQGTGVFHIAEMGVEKLVLDDCHFISCESVDSAAVLDTTITTVDVTCVMCQFVGCTGKDLNAVLSIVNCTSLTFLHNNFSLSLGLDKKRAIFIDMPGTLEIIGCSFSNNGGKLSKISVRERAGFLVMERRLEKVLIQDCSFQDIATEVDGGGIGLSMEMRKTGAYLTIIGCNFTRLSARDGGAVSVGYDYMNMPVYTTALVMKDCIVESCYADNGPGGAVCVDVTTWYSQITDCTFINNSAQQLGQSLHLRTSRNVIAFSKHWHIGRSNILNCTF